MAQATRTGVRLNHVEAGAGDPPIVFIHGWCCDLSYFAPQFDHFKSKHRVMAMDLRGCGASDRTEGGYDIPTLADDVAGLCRELGLAKAVIAGHSLGGMIAVEMAARHPSLVGAVVAVDPGPLAILPDSRATFEALIANMQGPDGQAVRREFVSGMFIPADDPERKRRIVDAMCSAPVEVAIAYLRGVIEWNGAGALSLCAAPLLVLTNDPGVDGSNDPRGLLALKPNIQFGVTVGAGHFHQLEVPEQVNAMIARFLYTLG